MFDFFFLLGQILLGEKKPLYILTSTNFYIISNFSVPTLQFKMGPFLTQFFFKNGDNNMKHQYVSIHQVQSFSDTIFLIVSP